MEEVEGLTVHPKYNEDDTVIETKEENDDQLMETGKNVLHGFECFFYRRFLLRSPELA